MIKHMGRHNNRQIVIVFRELPEPQAHMALVVYTDTLPSTIHQAVIQTVESHRGQNANDFADVLHTTPVPIQGMEQGGVLLQYLHTHGWLKKVQCKQVIVMANAKSSVRLDEINAIVGKLKMGDEGAQEMANLDAQAGLYDPKNMDNVVDVSQFRQDQPVPPAPMEVMEDAEVIPIHSEGVFGDAQIAQSSLTQAAQMENQIQGLIAESTRLREEAYSLDPSLKPKTTTAKVKKTTAKKAPAKKAVAKKPAAKKARAKKAVA